MQVRFGMSLSTPKAIVIFLISQIKKLHSALASAHTLGIDATLKSLLPPLPGLGQPPAVWRLQVRLKVGYSGKGSLNGISKERSYRMQGVFHYAHKEIMSMVISANRRRYEPARGRRQGGYVSSPVK
ncbi:MAG: hypothetical protein MK005_14010 [Alcanivorax sp.]|nr:hypothetical protein [Alcanivorax sp.]